MPDETWKAIRRKGYEFVLDLTVLAIERGELTSDARRTLVSLMETIGNTYFPDTTKDGEGA